MRAMFKLMRSGCCFVFLFISFPFSLPPTHPPAFQFSLKPTLGAGNLYAKQLRNTFWSAACRLGGRLTTRQSSSAPNDLKPPGKRRAEYTRRAADDIRSTHRRVSVCLKIQFRANKTKPDRLVLKVPFSTHLQVFYF